MKKLKILFDYTPLCREAKTGIPIFVEKLYEELSEIDTIHIEKTFLFCNYIPLRPWKMYRFVEHTLYHNIYLPFKLYWGKYDVYVENQYMFLPLFKPKHTTVVTFIYDIALNIFDTLHTKKHTENWRKKLPKSIANSDILLTISKSSKKDIENYLIDIGQNQKFLEYIYIDTHILKTTKTMEQSKEVLNSFSIKDDYFLYLGTLEPRKSPLRLIEAFDLFKKRSKSDIKLVFAGRKGWLYSDVIQYIEIHKLENEVIFTGYVSDEEKTILLQNCKAFVFLSIYEGFGIPPLEALRLGIPTLVSDIAVFHELFEESVLYANLNDLSDIATNMQKILESPPKIDIQKLARYSWDQSAVKFLNILHTYHEDKETRC